MNNKFLITVVGPTAIGKTSLAIKIAQHFNSEIISADSRQFYKEMEIGTAVPSKEELAAVRHHFIQNKTIKEKYSVGDFEKEAIDKLEWLFKQHKVVVMAGGSGLYINSVLKGLDYFPKVDPMTRKELNEKLKLEGIPALQQELEILDPEYYKKVDKQNPHRLIRALEISKSSGKPYSSFLKKEKKRRNFNSIIIGLEAPREIIYNHINQRVDLMMQQGLLKEVENLIAYQHYNALNTVGYKELFLYFENKLTLEEAISEIKKNTRRFAKRQLTWFKKEEEIQWFQHDASFSKIEEYIETSLRFTKNRKECNL